MTLLLGFGCGVPPAPVAPYAAEYEQCSGLASLVANAASGDDELRLKFPDAICENDNWYLQTDIYDRSDPPDRVTVATWNLLDGSFGASAWGLEGTGTLRAVVPTAQAGPCEEISTVWVFFPWWGDVLGQLDVVPRGDAYLGSGYYSVPAVTFHVDTDHGAADAGTMWVCEPFDDARAFSTLMMPEVEEYEDQWTGEWPRTREGKDTVFVVGGFVSAGGEPIAAAGLSGE